MNDKERFEKGCIELSSLAYDGGGLRLDPAPRVLFNLPHRVSLVQSSRRFAQVLSASSGNWSKGEHVESQTTAYKSVTG